MTIEEAIKHAEEVAEEQDKLCKRYDDESRYYRSHDKDIVSDNAKKCLECFECAKEHHQLAEWLKDYKRLKEQEPCEDVCEWFEQYVDIATDIVELRFSDGTVKRAKRGLYMRDIEKSIRKMLIDQIAQEPKTDTLDKIRAEIEQTVSRYSISRERGCIGQVEWSDRLIKESEVLQIIDKYTAKVEPYESEDK